MLQLGYLPTPTPQQTLLFTVLSLGFLVVIAALGLAALAVVWYRAGREQQRDRALAA